MSWRTRPARDPLQYQLKLLGPDRQIDPKTLSDEWNYGESPERYPIDTAPPARRPRNRRQSRRLGGARYPRGEAWGWRCITVSSPMSRR